MQQRLCDRTILASSVQAESWSYRGRTVVVPWSCEFLRVAAEFLRVPPSSATVRTCTTIAWAAIGSDIEIVIVRLWLRKSCATRTFFKDERPCPIDSLLPIRLCLASLPVLSPRCSASPSARTSLVQRLASIMQSRQNLSGENRLSADQIIDANACEKRSCVTCPVGVQAPIIGMAEVGNQSAIPGINLTEEPETAPAQALSALPSTIIGDARGPTRHHREPTLDLRELKALELAARAKIVFTNGHWLVPSQTTPSASYRVVIEPPFCECEDFATRQQPCKHVRARPNLSTSDRAERWRQPSIPT